MNGIVDSAVAFLVVKSLFITVCKTKVEIIANMNYLDNGYGG